MKLRREYKKLIFILPSRSEELPFACFLYVIVFCLRSAIEQADLLLGDW